MEGEIRPGHILKGIAWAFLGLIVVYALGFALGFASTGVNLAIYRFWAPQQEEARREVFEQSQSYVQGKVITLTRLRSQYERAGLSEARRSSLRTEILTEASTVDTERLPNTLKAFLSRLSD